MSDTSDKPTIYTDPYNPDDKSLGPGGIPPHPCVHIVFPSEHYPAIVEVIRPLPGVAGWLGNPLHHRDPDTCEPCAYLRIDLRRRDGYRRVMRVIERFGTVVVRDDLNDRLRECVDGHNHKLVAERGDQDPGLAS